MGLLPDKNSAIGVFDSGLGGLTVVRELMSLMPGQDIVYLGDTARVPYGVRSPETVRRYATEGTEFLHSLGIKLLVIACNTVSAVCLDEIASASPVPVVGVIIPGARAVARDVSGAVSHSKVGVIGTEATIASGAYTRAINELGPDIEVRVKACPLFVPLAEEGWLEGEVTELVVEKYLGEFMGHGAVDAIVLGCTHYPLLKHTIASVMGPDTRIIDSATETAREVMDVLGQDASVKDGSANIEFYVTDAPDKFKSVGERFLGTEIKKIKKIEFGGC